jgi:hypothetical protein
VQAADVTAKRAASPVASAGSLLRITELMPDPPEAGRDADFEWVEIANVGPVEISLAGYLLRDNNGEVQLPSVSVPAGAAIVVAAPLARIEGAVAFRLAGPISNGLANGGDRLALVAPDGRTIDALSYGVDMTYQRDGEAALPAPGPGRSLQRAFANDGSITAVTVSDEPTPGFVEPPAASTAGAAGQPSGRPDTPSPDRSDGNTRAWAVLVSLTVTALAAAAGLRLRQILRDSD